MPAATPCNTRAITKKLALNAKAEPSEATAKITNPSINMALRFHWSPQASRRDKCDPKSQYVAGDYQSCLRWCGVKRFFQRGQDDIDLDHIKDGQHSNTSGYSKSDPRRTSRMGLVGN